ncbi:glycosyltransferase family 4 protein [Laetiporus sulphureus 93-53]|uniref:Alpha-1,3/1,6-mannosyltransferase ALG2 n=1 Tax=Laetiporus sulphureus 93-53 TaxID=1314785 RepID=A0A165H240_9APHY|nr:glycosyltransferase family 4 protein [Laetiporus sulphureus 93-53]KZT11138.1 glycosyltransferase family 4 protein [Laetiporus sulphureus 93-53]
MASSSSKLRVAFVHPDLGIGGAERLVVDAALGLQKLGHEVDVYTSHHDPNHCFDETRDGTLRVHGIEPPFPRSFKGKFHILFSHARQLHLTTYLLRPSSPKYDVYFVDQLSTCIPFLRAFGHTRVVFYCHFPDKLLADGAYVEGKGRRSGSMLKRMYRFPMDRLEEVTTRQADIILANSKFTTRVFKEHFPSIPSTPKVVYPGINLSAYEATAYDASDPDIVELASERPTLLSLNRFEKKKNAALAVDAFALLRKKRTSGSSSSQESMRLIIAGGYDPRLEDNMMTLVGLIDRAKANSLTFNIVTPSTSRITIPPFNLTPSSPDILFLLNFTTAQRSALLTSDATLALLYTPMNEHFGIGPVEGMVCGLPILACNSGGPTESVIDSPLEERTGWLRPPEPEVWAEALAEIVCLSEAERTALAERARRRARENFGMDAMAKGLEEALKEAVGKGPVMASSLLLVCWALLAVFAALILRVFA